MLDLRWKLTWMSQDQFREHAEYCKHFKVLHDYIVIWICCEIESCLWIYMSRFKTWLIILFGELYYVVVQSIKIGKPLFGSLLANQWATGKMGYHQGCEHFSHDFTIPFIGDQPGTCCLSAWVLKHRLQWTDVMILKIRIRLPQC